METFLMHRVLQFGRGMLTGRSRWIRIAAICFAVFVALLIRTLIIRLQGCSIHVDFTYKVLKGDDLEFRGEPIKVEPRYLHQLKLPNKNFVMLDDTSVKKFVFVTGASSNHFTESLDCVASIQKHFPSYWIIYYDLGLTESQALQVQQMCSVIYRRFEFHLYPAHMQHIYTCSWKPAIIQEALRDFGGVMWVDASIRFQTGNLSTFYKKAVSNGGLVLTLRTGHSIYAATDPQTYEYLPAHQENLISTEMYGAGCMLIFNTAIVYDNVMLWWLLCSLYEDCMVPSYQSGCKWKDRYKDFANCHRFDQSVINILTGNYFNHNTTQYHVSEKDVVKTIKQPSDLYSIQYCGAVPQS